MEIETPNKQSHEIVESLTIYKIDQDWKEYLLLHLPSVYTIDETQSIWLMPPSYTNNSQITRAPDCLKQETIALKRISTTIAESWLCTICPQCIYSLNCVCVYKVVDCYERMKEGRQREGVRLSLQMIVCMSIR